MRREKRIYEAAAFLLLTALYYIAPWKSLPGSPEIWGIPFLFGYIVLFPGVFVGRLLGRTVDDRTAALTAAALYGLSFFLAVAFAWTLAGARLGLLLESYPAFTALLLVSWAIRGGGRAGEPHATGSTRSALIVIIPCIVVFFLLWKSGPSIGFTKDTLDHAAYVNEINKTGEAFPLTEFYVDAGENGKDVRKGLLHFFYGFSARYLGSDALPVLGAWNAVLAVLFVLSIYAATLALFADGRIASLSALIFLVSLLSGVGGTTIRETYYGNRFGFAFFMFELVFILRYLERKDARSLLDCMIFAFAAAAVHIFYAVVSCFALAVAAVWKICFPRMGFREHVSRIVTAGLVAGAGMAPYAFYRYVTAYGQPNEIHSQIQGVLYLTQSLFIADPVRLYTWFGLAGASTFLAPLFLWKEREKETGLGYLFAASFTIPIVLLNPILLVPLHRLLTYLVLRIPLVFPYYMLAAYFIVAFLGGTRRSMKRTLAGWALIGVMLVSLGIEGEKAISKSIFAPSRLQREKAESFLAWEDGLEFLRKYVPEGSVVASDPLTSYSIAARTPQYVACTLDQHASPGDKSLLTRLRKCRDIMSPFVDIRTTVSLLADLKAEYVVINNRPRRTPMLYYWSLDKRLYPLVREKFAAHEDVFDVLYERKGFIVLRWNGKSPAEEEPVSNPYFLSALPAGYRDIGARAGEAIVAAARMEDASAARGDSMRLSIVWTGERSYPMRGYVVSVRFDSEDPRLPSKTRVFSKMLRKVREKAAGERYRFRSDHKILGGMLGPDTWPPGVLVKDEAEIGIPPDVAPGRYEVSVKLMDRAFIPNFSLRDYLYDDDLYAGVSVGSIVIR